jgi:hypothetical protein
LRRSCPLVLRFRDPAQMTRRARSPRAGWSVHGYCSPIPKTCRFLRRGASLGVHHQTVQRIVERAAFEGPMAALDDRPRPGKEPTITDEAKTWIIDLSCRKAKDLGYPHELWTTRLLASHAREHGPAEGHPCLATLAQGTLVKILNNQEIKPHRVRMPGEEDGHVN